jgi:hypothetical protein
MTRILLVGYGKMGKLVESLAGEYKCEVAGIVDPVVGPDGVDSPRWAGVDVAIDFSSPDAVLQTMLALVHRPGHQHGGRDDRMGAAGGVAAAGGGIGRSGHRRGAEFFDRRSALRRGRGTGGEVFLGAG